ncbi:FGGY-family carbohydrate kinase [Candidatus Latescibacterota bacterium]
MLIIGVDVGTTGMKMGVFQEYGDTVKLVRQYAEDYPINTYNDGLFSDIEPEKWQKAFRNGCKEMSDLMADIDAISISGTTPGMTVMDKDGNALYPAILMLDQRSRKQAADIIKTIGMNKLMAETSNMPVAGGCSLASILWVKENHPDIFNKAACFGHSNTFFAKWLTGEFAIDPSSASLSALYNTVKNDLTWNKEIAETFGISLDQLPKVMLGYESPGRVKSDIAAELGLKKEPAVIIGGNDAVLAAYSIGIKEPGDVVNVNGTCEINLVCLGKCYPSRSYNIRAHVIPDRWLTLYVMNAEGKAFEWFQKLLCSEMTADEFYGDFMIKAVEKWLDRESTVTYTPYLMGSRYSLEPLKAEFLGLTPETTREELMAAMVKGLCEYQRDHLKEISVEVPLKKEIHVTGGAVNPTLIEAKKKWMRDCPYIFEEQSSMKGAAMLGQKHLNEK